MKSILRRRPSPALVIACLALFVSLGGVSYGVATGFIDSREIQNNTIRSADLRNNQIRTFDIRNNEVRGFDIRNSSVQGRDVAFNTLTGSDISEQDLGQVPSALAADTAANASAAGGVTPKAFDYQGESASDFVDVITVGGLTLRARCQGGAALEVQATTTVSNSEISSTFLPGNSDDELDPGETFILADTAVTGLGSAVFAGANGTVVTIEGLAVSDTNDVGGTTNDCGFSGVALAG